MDPLANHQKSLDMPAFDSDASLDGEQDEALDRLIKLAADMFRVPTAAIYLCIGDQLVVASAFNAGGDLSDDISAFCARIRDRGAADVLEDLSDSQALAKSDTGGPDRSVLFFAGVPVTAQTGRIFGILCIADVEPRPGFSRTGAANLQGLADLAADLIERRMAERSAQITTALLSAMSHDLRTPMNGVLGMAELLLAGKDLNDRHRRRVETIKRSGGTVLQILDRILDLAKTDNDAMIKHKTSIDLREIANTEVQLLKDKNYLEKDQVEICEYAQDHRIMANGTLVCRMFSHFFAMVAKIAAGSFVRLFLRSKRVGKVEIQVGVRAEIAELTKDAIGPILWQPTRIDDMTAGSMSETTLGLFVCRKLAMTLGGSLTLEKSSKGCLILNLDILAALDDGHSKEMSSAKRIDAVNPSKQSTEEDQTGHILVAEDDRDMALLFKDLLEEAGFKVTIVHDGASALRVLGATHFDAVLMDGRMPDMSGIEVTRRIRKAQSSDAKLPIIALTGDVLEGDREKYLSAGMDDYISKPVDCETLITTMRNCCIPGSREAVSDC